MATAQMIAASGVANKHLAGGDVARMANNIVKLKELQAYAHSEVEVLTLSTEDFIKNAANSTMRFLDFIFGANNTTISREKRKRGRRRLKLNKKRLTRRRKGVRERKERHTLLRALRGKRRRRKRL